MTTKICNKCNEPRDHVYFDYHNRATDNLRANCNFCEKSKKCKRCKEMQPMGKYKYCANKARRRDRTCTDCHIEMETNPSKYSPKPKVIKPKTNKDQPYSVVRTKAIMSVPIAIKKTHAFYMISQFKPVQKEINLR